MTEENIAKVVVEGEASKTKTAEESSAELSTQEPAEAPAKTEDAKPAAPTIMRTGSPAIDLIEKEIAVSNAPAQRAAKERQVQRRQVRQSMTANHIPRGQRTRFRFEYASDDVPRVKPERRFAPVDFSRAFLRKPLYLYSDRAQRFFEFNYERTDQNLIVSTLVVEAIGNISIASEVEKQIGERFDSIENDLINALNSLRESMTKAGFSEEEQVAAYDHKRHYEPPLHTPYSSRFMTVVSLFDRVIARTEAAWVLNVMPAQDRREILNRWEDAMRTLCRDLYRIRTQAMQKARLAGKGQEAKAIAQHVEREAKANLQASEESTDKIATAKAESEA